MCLRLPVLAPSMPAAVCMHCGAATARAVLSKAGFETIWDYQAGCTVLSNDWIELNLAQAWGLMGWRCGYIAYPNQVQRLLTPFFAWPATDGRNATICSRAQ